MKYIMYNVILFTLALYCYNTELYDIVSGCIFMSGVCIKQWNVDFDVFKKRCFVI